MSDRTIIVDGYNVIHRAPSLRPGPDRTLREARDKLVNLLSWTIGAGDTRIIVVFDGAEVRGADERGGRVEVRYSKPPRTADDDIRFLVEDRIERGDHVTVVTADLEVARHARAMGADISIADLFMASALGPAASGGGEGEKPGTLTRKELEEWAEVFRRRRKAEPAAPGGEPDEPDE